MLPGTYAFMQTSLLMSKIIKMHFKCFFSNFLWWHFMDSGIQKLLAYFNRRSVQPQTWPLRTLADPEKYKPRAMLLLGWEDPTLNNVRPITLMTEEISNDLVFSQYIKDTSSVQSAKYLPKNVLRKREFSHSGTEEMHVESTNVQYEACDLLNYAPLGHAMCLHSNEGLKGQTWGAQIRYEEGEGILAARNLDEMNHPVASLQSVAIAVTTIPRGRGRTVYHNSGKHTALTNEIRCNRKVLTRSWIGFPASPDYKFINKIKLGLSNLMVFQSSGSFVGQGARDKVPCQIISSNELSTR